MIKNPLGEKIPSDKVGKQKKDESGNEEKNEDYGAKSGKNGKKSANNCEIQKTG